MIETSWSEQAEPWIYRHTISPPDKGKAWRVNKSQNGPQVGKAECEQVWTA